MSYPRSIDA